MPILDSAGTKLKLVLENINTKSGRNVLTAKSKPILTLNLKMTKLNSQTKMTKSISRKMTISTLEWMCFVSKRKGAIMKQYTKHFTKPILS